MIVADLPGGKKITGFAAPSFNGQFCTLCKLTRDKINDINCTCWEPRDVQVLKDAAYQWKNAPDQATRARIFAAHGIRWSELWRLSYFDPVAMVIVDGMHTLFERVVSYHCRTILGIDHAESEEQIVTPAQLVSAKTLLASNLSQSKLKTLTVAVLKALCAERGVDIPFLPNGERVKKAHILDQLLQSQVSHTHDVLSLVMVDTHSSLPTWSILLI